MEHTNSENIQMVRDNPNTWKNTMTVSAFGRDVLPKTPGMMIRKFVNVVTGEQIVLYQDNMEV